MLSIATTLSDPYIAGNFAGPERFDPSAALRAGLVLLALMLSTIGLRKRLSINRKMAGLLLLLGIVGSGLGLYGCVGAENFRKLGTPPGDYTVTVTATMGSGNGAVEHSTTVSLTVVP
jgi:hypothetical protein